MKGMSGSLSCSTPWRSHKLRSTRRAPRKSAVKAADEKVVVRANGALDAAETGRGVFTNPQTLIRDALHKRIAGMIRDPWRPRVRTPSPAP